MAQENLEEKIAELEKKSEEYLNGWKRERADFLNYKKDEMERIGNLIKYANEEIILKLLPVLDNICLAEKHIKDEGLTQIKKQLEDFLKKEGIEPIEVVGKPFDPNIMEAVGEVDESEKSKKTDKLNENNDNTETDGLPMSIQSGAVIEEIQLGYTLHGKLIRPARVKISK
jgi:molecular chaperone GrpE